MIKIDKDKFEKIVLAATSSTAEVFDMMEDPIAVSTAKLKSTVFGTVIDFEALPEVVVEDVERFICLDAFYDAMPGLDLVLTSTGFGIVNNQNLSPASRDRVETLRKSIRQAADDAMDAIISGLIGNDDWAASAYGKLLISSLYYSAVQLRDYAGKPEAYRSDLIALRPVISEAEEIIYRNISAVLFEHLLEQTRAKTLTEYETLLVWMLRKAVGFFVNQQSQAFKRELDNAVNFLEGNIDKFSVYQESEAYKVKHFERYKNEKDDSCYFWG
jgi:hypothetical protein|nr:MAG TPA: hypothetical protein [Caudoviricetes sp.]